MTIAQDFLDRDAGTVFKVTDRVPFVREPASRFHVGDESRLVEPRVAQLRRVLRAQVVVEELPPVHEPALGRSIDHCVRSHSADRTGREHRRHPPTADAPFDGGNGRGDDQGRRRQREDVPQGAGGRTGGCERGLPLALAFTFVT